MNIEELRQSNKIIFEYIRGSHLYNLNIATSDIDMGGIFRNYKSEWLQLYEPSSEIQDIKGDESYMEIKKYMKLACTANPTVLEAMYIPEKFIKKTSKAYDLLRSNRDLFITKKCAFSFSGYAFAQIKRAKGQNKKVWNYEEYVNETGINKLAYMITNDVISIEWLESKFNANFANYIIRKKFNGVRPITENTDWSKMDPQLNDPDIHYMMSPRRENFCYYIPERVDSRHSMPYRPISLDSLNEYDISSVEHMANTYRLYKNGKGVFKNNQLVFTSIPKEREWTDIIGILTYNEDEYKKAYKEYTSFWEWMSNRNENRWKDMEDNSMDYDKKNMMHTMRLLLEAESIVNTGSPRIYFENGDREFLMNIRYGKYTYEYLLKTSEEKMETMKKKYEESSLPNDVNMKKVFKLYEEIVNV